MKHFWIFLTLLIISMSAFAQKKTSTKEIVLDKKRGFLTCSGGTSAPLFKQDCKLLTIHRVSFGGDIIYEAQCKDSSGTDFFVTCIAFSYEPDLSMSVPGSQFTR